jgi:VWFA-related protein
VKLKYCCSMAVAALLLCHSPSLANPKDKDKEGTDVKFTAQSELVLVPTLVTDKSGNHVKGLTKEDFRVTENGVEQKLATFEEITSDPHRLSRAASPNEFSNALTGSSSASRVTVIVLDLINTQIMDQASARRDLLKYLAQSVDRTEPTGLYTLTRSGLQVVHDFTTDPGVLIAALRRVRGDASEAVDSAEEAEALTGTADPDGSSDSTPAARSSTRGNQGAAAEAQRLQAMLGDAELNFQAFEQRIAITYTLDGMQEISQALAGLPGRKSLIWAGGGFPFNVSDTMQIAPAGRDSLADVLPLYERTWQLLNNAQIALYPIDVKGLEVTALPSASLRNPSKNFGRKMNNKQFDTQATFQTFASETGGRAYYNSNDLVKGFHDAVKDSSEYYVLGYYLDRSVTKSGWRKLSVKTDRDHVDVRARGGFFVTPTTADPDSSRKNDISSALQSPLDYTSLPLVERWTKTETGKDPGKKRVSFEMTVAPNATAIDDADNNHMVLDFVALAKNPEGKMVGQPFGQKVDLHLTPEKLASIRQKGVVYRDALDLLPGEYTVRFVVRDDISGRTGSVSALLKVE